MIMDRSKSQNQVIHEKRSRRRNNTSAIATTFIALLIVPMVMLASTTKYVSAFTSSSKIKYCPASCSTFINRCTNRLPSQGSVRFKTKRATFKRFHRDSLPDIDVNSALPPVLLVEGIFAVDKPLDWTSQDVVAYIRAMFERDARVRGADPGKVGSKKNKHRQVIRCGHGGTLDPLATGVLVIGLGSGTKMLQSFLNGGKKYRAEGTFGFETETLDMAGNVTKSEKFDHINRENVEAVIPHFKGRYLQDPPIYSAIHKEGKRLHELARAGMTAEDVQIQPRAVEVYELDLVEYNSPKFEVDVHCGSGFYIRSLIRDIGYSCDSVATTTKLQRTKQGPFTLDDILLREDWTVENMNALMEKTNAALSDDEPFDVVEIESTGV